MPVVDDSGQNSIVMAPRANMRLTPEDVRGGLGPDPGRPDVLLLQGEVPMDASLAAARIAREAGATVILNAAPAVAFPPALLALTDVLVVNEYEAAALAEDPDAAAAADWPALARKLLRRRAAGGHHHPGRPGRLPERRRQRGLASRPRRDGPSTPPAPATPSAAPSPPSWPVGRP